MAGLVVPLLVPLGPASLAPQWDLPLGSWAEGLHTAALDPSLRPLWCWGGCECMQGCMQVSVSQCILGAGLMGPCLPSPQALRVQAFGVLLRPLACILEAAVDTPGLEGMWLGEGRCGGLEPMVGLSRLGWTCLEGVRGDGPVETGLREGQCPVEPAGLALLSKPRPQHGGHSPGLVLLGYRLAGRGRGGLSDSGHSSVL